MVIPVAAIVAASPAPSPVPTPAPRWVLRVSGSNVFVDQAANGPGLSPPEGPGFAAGEPAAPMTPYDWFASTPQTPGIAGVGQYLFGVRYRSGSFTANADVLVTGFGGNVTTGIYWGEPLLGPLDPHQGHSPIPYHLGFPTHAGSNDVVAGQVVLPYSASVGDDDGLWSVSGGYVNPSRYDAFVFTPPGLTSWLPSLGVAPLEGANLGVADLDSWKHVTGTLPLLGVDATANMGPAQLEATDALLPSYPGLQSRLWGTSVAIQGANESRFSANLIHVWSTGDAIPAPVLFGSSPELHPGPQGNLATSTIASQSQTIAGIRAFFHPLRGYDAALEYGRAWYDAGTAVRPGSTQPGNYEHVALARHFNTTDDLGAEYYRFDPHYATMLLPYGIQENIWGIAWAYPGPWLKGGYQLAQNSVAGANRAGVRFYGDLTRGKLQLRASYYSYRQLFPSSLDNLTQTGFVEVDYLVQAPGDTALGQTQGLSGYAGWNFGADTLAVDYVRDTERRGYAVYAPQDGVAMQYPQVVFSEQHRFTPNVSVAGGYARYAAAGEWATTPVYGVYGLAFLGGEYSFDNGRQQLFVQLRRYGTIGLPSIPGGPPPTYRGTTIVVDHHIELR